MKPKYKEFEENATLGQQSTPSHAEQKHQTISNNNYTYVCFGSVFSFNVTLYLQVGNIS